ncbi:MAG: EndoU domain-containing protein [Sphingobacteriales bacterium]|nr:EndoU domain-containing protein [Sphingobacteriales bacterium]
MHHISALMADPVAYRLAERTPTNMGCYKAKLLKPDGSFMYNKDFFPDEWDENKVIDEIKVAWGNMVDKQDVWGSGKYLGYTSPPENIPVEIKMDGNKIKTAWPRWNP